ncbi:hypothetical protein TWF788_002749 [Orbilia oligospora]|uniref:Uncharacterized protein n=1 Tax=Orbilia oligospora TaxID=2813651 RepID=A0A7C8NYH8_ORBOL|nr:hypothetical protein TWF788_002749 [Orbilia oligospora]
MEAGPGLPPSGPGSRGSEERKPIRRLFQISNLSRPGASEPIFVDGDLGRENVLFKGGETFESALGVLKANLSKVSSLSNRKAIFYYCRGQVGEDPHFFEFKGDLCIMEVRTKLDYQKFVQVRIIDGAFSLSK